jgi:hypothetical protein
MRHAAAAITDVQHVCGVTACQWQAAQAGMHWQASMYDGSCNTRVCWFTGLQLVKDLYTRTPCPQTAGAVQKTMHKPEHNT